MTDKELRKLRRADLLELLMLQSREADEQKKRIEELEQQLASHELQVARSGSLAEAAVEVNGVLEAAQTAADQYLENITAMEEDTQRRCDEMEAAAMARCLELLKNTERQAEAFWRELEVKLDRYISDREELSQLFETSRLQLERGIYEEKEIS